LYLVARKLQVRPHIRIARRNALSLLVGGDGPPELAGLEQSVAPVKVDGFRSSACLEKLFVTRRRFYEFALFV
jgi:hypothetical protein